MSGYNCVALPGGEVIYLDICDKGALLKRTIDDSKTDRFESQPSQINQNCVLFDYNGILSLLYLAADHSNKLLGVGHLKAGKWEFHECDETDLILSQKVNFTSDKTHLYVFSDNPYESKSFFIAVLKLNGQKYVVERKINIDWIKTEAKFDKLPQPRPLVAGASVIGRQMYIFYTGPGCETIDTAPIDSVAVINLDSGEVGAKHGLKGLLPNFSVFRSPTIHLHGNKIVSTNLGSVAVLTIGTWEWAEIFQIRFHPIMDTGLGSGSTITDKGKVLVCWKHTPEKDLHLAQVDL